MWQLCPKCQGQRTVSKPPWVPGDMHEWIATQTAFTCDMCNGDGKLWAGYEQPEIDTTYYPRPEDQRVLDDALRLSGEPMGDTTEQDGTDDQLGVEISGTYTATEARGYAYGPWRTNKDIHMPDDLSPMQLVQCRCRCDRDDCVGNYGGIALHAPWTTCAEHREWLHDGHPCVDGRDLEEWARYVAKDRDGTVWQHPHKPWYGDAAWYAPGWRHCRAPDTYAKPGDPANSLMAVNKEG